MKIKNDYKSLVIAGGWNKYIFNPEWVKKYLFPKDEIGMEFPINVDGSARFSTDKIRISIEQNRLNFYCRSNDLSDYELIQELAIKIADYLPHTPVLSYGVNFLYEETLKVEKITALLNCDHSKILASAIEKDIISNEIKNSLNYGYCTLNNILKYEKGTYSFDFNYHFTINKLTDFKESIAEHSILALRKDSLEFMLKIYDLSIDEE
jgi:hypothetical protein